MEMCPGLSLSLENLAKDLRGYLRNLYICLGLKCVFGMIRINIYIYSDKLKR